MNGHVGTESSPSLRTVDDLAGYLRISRQQVYNLVRSCELQPVRVGNRLRFRAEEIERYLAENTERAP
jgi:excisionase family DNA binding protein